jgi:hypothetical protein
MGMKKALTILLLILSGIIILDSLNAGHAVVMFLLAGVIPGTNIIMSADQTLELFTLLIGFTLSRSTLAVIRMIRRKQEIIPVPLTQIRPSIARA